MLLASCGQVDSFLPVSGVDYVKLPTPSEPLRIENYQETLQPTSGKVEVIEVFWYACSSCYRFQPYVSELREFYKDEVVYKKIPAPLNPTWTTHSLVFLVAQNLGIQKDVHQEIYRLMHEERRRVSDSEQFLSFFGELGVNPDAVRLSLQSKAVQNNLEEIQKYVTKHRITSVPTLIIDGKYLVPEGNNPQKAIDTAYYLIGQALGTK